MQFECLSPLNLTEEDADTWRRLAALQPETRSAFLGPDWPRFVTRLDGPDARKGRVVIVRDAGQAVGFFSYRQCGRIARAIGAPFADYQGWVLKPDVSLNPLAMLAAMEVDRLDLHHTPKESLPFVGALREASAAPIVRLDEGYDAYVKERRAAGSRISQDCAKKRRKLQQVGRLRFTPLNRDPNDLEQLLHLKRRQYLATGQRDVLAPSWARELFKGLQRLDAPWFSGALFTLHLDDQLVAGHFALRGGDVLHAWIIGHDARHGAASPGAVLIDEILRWASANGVRELDFGLPAHHYKTRFANRCRPMAAGFLARPSWAGTWRGVQWGVRQFAQSAPLGPVSDWPGKLMRRFDRDAALRDG